jgi:hypothetical protein
MSSPDECLCCLGEAIESALCLSPLVRCSAQRYVPYTSRTFTPHEHSRPKSFVITYVPGSEYNRSEYDSNRVIVPLRSVFLKRKIQKPTGLQPLACISNSFIFKKMNRFIFSSHLPSNHSFFSSPRLQRVVRRHSSSPTQYYYSIEQLVHRSTPP